MRREVSRYLDNFPARDGDTYERLLAIVKEKTNGFEMLTDSEKARLQAELSTVEEMGVSCVILAFYDTMAALKGVGALFHGLIHCSFLCYVLGLTLVNPLEYDLPFERYFRKAKKGLPVGAIVVKEGKKGRVISYLKKRYGADKIARVLDRKEEYVISLQSLAKQGRIAETILHTEEGRKPWREAISSLTSREAGRACLFTLTVQEAKVRDYRLFDDLEAYEKAEELWKARGLFPTKFVGNKEVESIFSATGGRYLYQEQFCGVCTKLLGVNGEKADEYRVGLAVRKKETEEELRRLFVDRFGEEGEKIFDYVQKWHVYAFSKACVIGLLFLEIKEED